MKKSAFSILRNRKIGYIPAAVLILMSSMFGYVSFSGSVTNACHAQSTNPAQTTSVTVTGSNCTDSTGYWCSMYIVWCIVSTSAQTTPADHSIKNTIEQAADALENRVYDEFEGFTKAALNNINTLEDSLIQWWDTMWTYNLQPGLKKMTTQMNIDTVQQTKDIQKATDIAQATDYKKEVSIAEAEDKKTVPTDDNGCATATVAGGLGRATAFGKAMRSGLQNRGLDAGSNRRGTRGAMGIAGINRSKSETYESTFCDPNDNGGQNTCGTTSDPAFYNADTKATEILFNKLTIPVTNPKYQAATEAIVENMIGNPGAEPLQPSALKSNQGREIFLMQRSRSARYAAAQSVTNLIAGWKMPGAGPDMAKWVAELRRGGAATPFVTNSDLSANPSYFEIMHAITVDRFNSTGYANSLITNKNSIEMEKLALSTFHLMLLRDYYELLERTALALSVQVSIMADQQPMITGSKFTKVGDN